MVSKTFYFTVMQKVSRDINVPKYLEVIITASSPRNVSNCFLKSC